MAADHAWVIRYWGADWTHHREDVWAVWDYYYWGGDSRWPAWVLVLGNSRKEGREIKLTGRTVQPNRKKVSAHHGVVVCDAGKFIFHLLRGIDWVGRVDIFLRGHS